MKKQLLLLLITILSINCYAQISFEKGYYIDNSNQKVDCLIKNIDWKNNPTEFEYKLTEHSSKKTATIKTIKEFGIYNISKYSRQTIDIDRSSNIMSEISNDKNAILKKEQLFLKVLIEGKANLYSFEDGSLNRYFYSKDDSKIQQLIFKRYLSIDNKIGENNRYQQQLWTDLKCSTFKISKIKNVDYKKNELIKFFVEYNECNSQEFTNFEEKQKKDLFNLSIRPGINNSSLSIQNAITSYNNTDFDNELGFRLGIEGELIMPFNKNKWAVIIEPTYQYFKSEKKLTGRSNKVDYKSIELPIGIRHYFFLGDNAKIFINGSFIFDLSGNSNFDFGSGANLEIKSKNNLAFGLGYKHNDKYSLELRYQTDRDLLSNYLYWSSNYNTLSLIFGYSLF
ncbi:tRNA modification GTPase [Algibacter sp. 2305UL17-15]|uniref:tRNA modification GTPase n=1 Tax=Algibacter sp. 2305UL17-15 TaxID=3231268 RepID=UPI0034583BC9